MGRGKQREGKRKIAIPKLKLLSQQLVGVYHGTESELSVYSLAVAVFVMCVLACGSAVLVLVVVRRYCNTAKPSNEGK